MQNLQFKTNKMIPLVFLMLLFSSENYAEEIKLVKRVVDEEGRPIVTDPLAYPRCYQYEYTERCIDLRSIPDIDESEPENKQIVSSKFKKWQIGPYKMHMYSIIDSMNSYSNVTVNSAGKIFAAGGPQLQFLRGEDQADQTWERRFYSRFSDSFRDIKQIDQTLFAVGTSGVIYRSRNFGENWEVFTQIFIDPFSYQDLEKPEIEEKWHQFHEKMDDLKFKYTEAYSIAFDPFSSTQQKNGVVVGYEKILHTSDTGQTWKKLDFSLKDDVLQEATFSEKDHVWAVGTRGTVIKSVDAGQTWTKQTVLNPQAHWLSIDFINPKKGCLSGSGEIWCTENAGVDWQKSKLNLPKTLEMGDRIMRLRWMDTKEAWAVVTTGQILKTVDGGKNWSLFANMNQLDPRFKQVQLWGLFVDRSHKKIYASGGLLVNDDAKKSDKKDVFSDSGIILTWQK